MKYRLIVLLLRACRWLAGRIVTNHDRDAAIRHLVLADAASDAGFSRGKSW